MTPTNELPGVDEAITLTVEYLRAVIMRPAGVRGDYGYDMWVPSVSAAWAHKASGAEPLKRESLARRASPVFFEAAWELCRRGIIRPGIRETGGQAVAGGCGYSLTTPGREWLLEDGDPLRFVVPQPGGLAAALGAFRDRFGDGFFQRAQEAVRCRDAEAWVAACVMIGAAAESILLAAAVARAGNEDAVLKTYGAANGRKKLIADVTAAAPQFTRPFSTIAGLIAYWRDDTAHNQATVITGLEAEQAMRELLRLAQFTADNWDALTVHRKEGGKRARPSQGAEKREQAAPAPLPSEVVAAPVDVASAAEAVPVVEAVPVAELAAAGETIPAAEPQQEVTEVAADIDFAEFNPESDKKPEIDVQRVADATSADAAGASV